MVPSKGESCWGAWDGGKLIQMSFLARYSPLWKDPYLSKSILHFARNKSQLCSFTEIPVSTIATDNIVLMANNTLLMMLLSPTWVCKMITFSQTIFSCYFSFQIQIFQNFECLAYLNTPPNFLVSKLEFIECRKRVYKNVLHKTVDRLNKGFLQLHLSLF